MRILSDYGTPIIDYLIQDSGVEGFREAIAHYLSEEKRPQLLSNLAEDLQPICATLRKNLIEDYQYFEAQPNTVAAIQEQELLQLNQDLIEVSQDLKTHLDAELNSLIGTNGNAKFETDFHKLQGCMVKRLDELLHQFSVAEIHKQAQASHKRNSVVPLLGILAEAFYYLSNGLESVLVESSEVVVHNFFKYLRQSIASQNYYQQLLRLTGADAGIEDHLQALEQQVCHAIHNEARRNAIAMCES
ncbi:MAG: dynamin family protein, partial [Polaribacter sp.]|nr:dynamin family protein [Polaribacter sp.]